MHLLDCIGHRQVAPVVWHLGKVLWPVHTFEWSHSSSLNHSMNWPFQLWHQCSRAKFKVLINEAKLLPSVINFQTSDYPCIPWRARSRLLFLALSLNIAPFTGTYFLWNKSYQCSIEICNGHSFSKVLVQNTQLPCGYDRAFRAFHCLNIVCLMRNLRWGSRSQSDLRPRSILVSFRHHPRFRKCCRDG